MPSTSLRDDLDSLRIERRPAAYRPARDDLDRDDDRGRARRGGGGGGGGGGIVSALLWMIPISIVAGAAAIGYVQYDKMKPKPKVVVALVQKMTAGEAEKVLSAKGYLKSRHQAMIGAKTPGRVEKILVEEGTKVRRGDLIAVLEHNDLDALLESRRATVKRTEAELMEARAEFDEKDRRAQRWQKLRSVNQASLDEADTHIMGRQRAAAKVAGIEAAITLMNASVRETEETIRNMSINAPFDGTIVSKEAEVGETITPGGMGQASGRGSVATLANLAMLEVETDVAENLLGRLTIDQPAEVAVSAVPGRRYRGTLRQIIPMGDRARGTVKVKVAIVDPDALLFPELVATVHFLPGRAGSAAAPAAGPALFVAKAAIVEEAGHSYAWRVDEKGAARRLPVEVVVGRDDLARVEKGLEPGDAVVLNPPKTLRDGAAVKVED